MEESDLDLDKLTGLINSIFREMNAEELSEIYSLLETGKLQHLILELIGAGGRERTSGEVGSVTALLQSALQQRLEEKDTAPGGQNKGFISGSDS
ncbi:MAG: hypothetical protein GX878_02565 [Firmicutes bacterium]|nr:hypothetical protein [Bacillota bacterium]